MKLMSLLRMALVITALLAAGVCASAWAHDHDEQDEAHEAVEHGQIRPLSQILAQLKLQDVGEIVRVKLRRKGERWIYELRSIDSRGQIREFSINAATGSAMDDGHN